VRQVQTRVGRWGLADGRSTRRSCHECGDGPSEWRDSAAGRHDASKEALYPSAADSYMDVGRRSLGLGTCGQVNYHGRLLAQPVGSALGVWLILSQDMEKCMHESLHQGIASRVDAK
jgi:hypothetical protein